MPQGIEGQGSAPAAQIAQFRSDGFSAQTGLRIPFFSDAFSRAFGFPDVHPVNLISEETPIREERPYAAFVGLREVHYSRPALVTGAQWGSGPIRGVFCQPGVGYGHIFAVSGNTVYLGGVSQGTIPGNDLVRFAASPTQVVAVSESVAYLLERPDELHADRQQRAAGGLRRGLSGRAVRLLLHRLGDVVLFRARRRHQRDRPRFPQQQRLRRAQPGRGRAERSTGLLHRQHRGVLESTSPTRPIEPVLAQRGARLSARHRVSRHGRLRRQLALLGGRQPAWSTAWAIRPRRISSSSIEDKMRQCANGAGDDRLRGDLRGPRVLCAQRRRGGDLLPTTSAGSALRRSLWRQLSRGTWTQWESWGQGRSAARSR